jgi:hypothetical protein
VHRVRRGQREGAGIDSDVNRLAMMQSMGVSSSSKPPGACVPEKPRRSFRHVLVRVMAVQVISLAVLWWLQARYGR